MKVHFALIFVFNKMELEIPQTFRNSDFFFNLLILFRFTVCCSRCFDGIGRSKCLSLRSIVLLFTELGSSFTSRTGAIRLPSSGSLCLPSSSSTICLICSSPTIRCTSTSTNSIYCSTIIGPCCSKRCVSTSTSTWWWSSTFFER